MASGDDFRAVQQVKLDSLGGGQVTLTPPGSVTWVVSLSSIAVSSRVQEPVFKLYRDTVADINFLEGSYSGSQDSTDTQHIVRPGQSLIGVWTGGDIGATATLRISGQVA